MCSYEKQCEELEKFCFCDQMKNQKVNVEFEEYNSKCFYYEKECYYGGYIFCKGIYDEWKFKEDFYDWSFLDFFY